jgi:hypothetical protein
MTYPVPSTAMKAAMDAHSDLNIFAAIEAILEGGTIHGSNATAAKIIGLCRTECQRQLRLMDKAVAATKKESA